MMNIDYEMIFVENIVMKDKRKRLKYELANKKKRKDAIGRFCHNSIQYINQDKIIIKSCDLDVREISGIIKQYTSETQCYLISWDDETDGRIHNLEQALDLIYEEGMASILILEKVVVIKEEQESGAPMKYILRVN